MVFLETSRLVLRNWEAGDLEELVDYRNDDRCTRYQRGQLHEREELAALIQRRKNDTFLPEGRKQLAIALKETNQLVGEITIFLEDPAITMGYTVSYKHHRQGYAYEMLSAVIAQLHGCYPDREFICMVEPENVASMGLLKKLGFDHICYAPEVTSEVFGKWTLPKE